MPRNASGTYTLPLPPVLSDTIIESVWANTSLDDLAQSLTDSLDRYGRGAMVAPLRFVDGTVGSPGFAWQAETGTGFYRESAGVMAAAVQGAKILQWSASGLTLATGAKLSLIDPPAVGTDAANKSYVDAVAGVTPGLASKASTLADGGGNGVPMTFTYAGQGGQPQWVWGRNDSGGPFYVWNPANFGVAYANNAGTAGTASNALACSGNSATASSATTANNALACSGNAATATNATNAYACSGNAATATNATNAYACSGNAATATNATNANNATTAGTASTVVTNGTIGGLAIAHDPGTNAGSMPIGSIIWADSTGLASPPFLTARALNTSGYLIAQGNDSVNVNIQYGTWRQLGRQGGSSFGLWMRTA